MAGVSSYRRIAELEGDESCAPASGAFIAEQESRHPEANAATRGAPTHTVCPYPSASDLLP